MKSGGKFSHLRAIGQSLIETLKSNAKGGVIGQYQDLGLLPQNNSTVFTASNIEKSLIKEPVQGFVGGIWHLFGNAVEQAGGLKNAGGVIYHVVKDIIKGPGESLGEGLAEMYTARTSDQLVEGLSRFFGAVGGAAGMAAGGVGGAATKLAVPTLTTTGGAGVGSLAVATTTVGAPAVTAVAGAVAGGAWAHAMVGEQTSAGVQGGGKGNQSGAVPRKLSGSWKEKGQTIRSLSDEELVLNAEKYAEGLGERRIGGYHHSRPVADLIVQELKRRGKGKEPVTTKLEKAINDSFYDYNHQLDAQGRLEPDTLPRENWTAVELRGRTDTTIKRFENGVDTEVISFHRQLVQELRERSLAFEGEEASAMRGLADRLDVALQRVGSRPGLADGQIFQMDFERMARGSSTPDLIREAKNVLKNDAGVDCMRAYAKELRARALPEGPIKRGRMNRLAGRLEAEIRKVEQEQAAAALAEPEFPADGRLPSERPIRTVTDAELQREARLMRDYWNRGGSRYYSGAGTIVVELRRRGFSDLAGELEGALAKATPRMLGRE